MTTSTLLPIQWSPAVGEPVEWDYHLQELLDSVRQGIAEAVRGAGRYITEAELAPDDDE